MNIEKVTCYELTKTFSRHASLTALGIWYIFVGKTVVLGQLCCT